MIPTPIGNLKDITYRAVEILRSVDFIFCEDTRRTKKLLNHFNIASSPKRYNEHSETCLKYILQLLKENKKIALTSDGGTPCISDPGCKIVTLAKENNIEVVSLPGASAVTCALASSGFGGGGAFVFLGFLPRKKSKIIDILKNAMEFKKPVIIFESPYRIISLLQILMENFDSNMQVSVARELTKIYEEQIYGSLREVYEKLCERKKIKGEIVLILGRIDN